MGKRRESSVILMEVYGGNKHSDVDIGGQDSVGERNLSMSCSELRHIRRYLLLVGQWYPEEWSLLKKNLFHVWQIMVTIGVWLYFAYSLGFFGVPTLETQHLKGFPISAITDIVSESRWVISHHLGLWYFCRCRHFERFLEGAWLSEALWRETSRYLKRICFSVIMLVFILPVSLRPAELFYSIGPQEMWKIIMDTSLLAIHRLVTAPIFLVFVLVAYVLVRVVKGYGERIKTWPINYNGVEGSGWRMAKLQFTEIKALIRSVESAFQVYLALHFLLLLVTAVLGIFACFEQVERGASGNRTYYNVGHPKYYSRIGIAQTALIRPQLSIVPITDATEVLKNNYVASQNNRSEIKATKLKSKPVISGSRAMERQVMIEVGIEAVLRIFESIVLYMIPLTLILRLQTKLRIVSEVIGEIDCYQQTEERYLFHDQQSIDKMRRIVDGCRGFTIFGYKLPLFRSFLLAAFAPFVTALTTFLFSYIHVRPR